MDVTRRNIIHLLGIAPAVAAAQTQAEHPHPAPPAPAPPAPPPPGSAAAPAAAAAQTQAAPAPAAPPAPAKQAYQRKVFDDHQWRSVEVLCDLIIPADEHSGSATAAGVPEFIDDWLDFRAREDGNR